MKYSAITTSLTHLEGVHMKGLLIRVIAVPNHWDRSRHAPKGIKHVHMHPAHLQHFFQFSYGLLHRATTKLESMRAVSPLTHSAQGWMMLITLNKKLDGVGR